MRHSLLRHHVQKEIIFKRNMYSSANVFKQTDKVVIGKNCSKSFSDASNSSDNEEEIIKYIKTLKPFKMEPRKAIPKKPFA